MNVLIKFLFVMLLVFGSFANGFAQSDPGVPNGSVGKNSRDAYDNGTRIRSIELERIKRESYRSAAAQKAADNRRINFSQIKEDFELLQKLQNEIIKTYVTGKQINYGRISELSSKLNDCAERLDKNLLLSTEKNVKKSDEKDSNVEEVKGIIVVLDKSIGKFVTSPVFQNLGVIEPDDAEKAEVELQNIIRLSNFLARKADLQK
jgi:hypothetical protein